MIAFIIGSVRQERLRSALLLGGVLLVVCTSLVLSGAASTSELRVQGAIARSFRPAYDILVRPASDVTPFERQQGLVRDNYLSQLFGGISTAQLDAIEHIQGIEAAPIENLGYVLASETVDIPFRPPRSGPSHQLFRLTAEFTLAGSSASWGTAYIYVARYDRTTSDPPDVTEQLGGRSAPIHVCGPQSVPADYDELETSPFTMGQLDGYITCYSEVTPGTGSYPGGKLIVPVEFIFPMLLSAIDPGAEARMFGLDRALNGGQYLSEGEGARASNSDNLGRVLDVPVIASSLTDLDERLTLASSLVAESSGIEVPRMLASPKAATLVAQLHPIADGSDAHTEVLSAQTVYRRLIAAARIGSHSNVAELPVPEYWTTSQSRYSSSGRRSVSVAAVHIPESVWRSPPGWGNTAGIAPNGQQIAYSPAPPGNCGTGFEELDAHLLRSPSGHSVVAGAAGEPPVANLDVVGTFDPNELPGYSALSKVPLETFASPLDVAANRATEEAIGRRVLGPTTDLSGYVAQPPLLLTTLSAAHAMLAQGRYTPSDAGRPISAVLVRLRGGLGPGQASRQRIEAAAEAIRQATGLSVEITDGSSPTPIAVRLAGGLKLVEQWTRLGVAYRIVGATDVATIALLATSGLGGLIFVATASLALVRRRRRDIAILSSLGWRRSHLVRGLGGVILILAVVGAMTGAMLAVAIASTMGLHLSLASAGEAGVLLPVTAVAASLPAVVVGTRHTVVARLAGSSRRGGTACGRLALAWASVRAAPGRALLGARALAIGLASYGVVVAVQGALSGRLDSTRTLLGSSIELQLRGLDVAAAVSTLALGAGAVVCVLLAGSSERRRTHAVLAASGWRPGDLTWLMLVEALLVVSLGVVWGLALAGVMDALLSVPFQVGPILLAAAASALVVLLAMGIPVGAGLTTAPVAALHGGF